MQIIAGDFSDSRIIDLLQTHYVAARAASPPCSAHALDLAALRAADVSFWAAWDGEMLLGVGALKQLSSEHGELKSMHTHAPMRGKGVGAAILRHVIAVSRQRGYSRLSLETGSMDYFIAARALYRRHGFRDCAPFGGYGLDPNSVFMTLELATSNYTRS